MHLLQSSLFVGELLRWMVIVNHEDAFLKASEEVSRVRYPTLRDYIVANVRAHHQQKSLPTHVETAPPAKRQRRQMMLQRLQHATASAATLPPHHLWVH